MAWKILGDEVTCNSTPNSFVSKFVRVLNTSGGLRTVSVENVELTVEVTVNTDVNATTLFLLSSGTTQGIVPGRTIVQAANTGVVNTDVASEVAVVINSTAFASNVDVIFANGTTTVSVSNGNYTTTLNDNAEVVIYKGGLATLVSNNNTDVLATPVSIVG